MHPQRDRIGFDDALLNEEGRMVNNEDGAREDDYEHYLTDEGYSGMEFSHGHSNDYNYAHGRYRTTPTPQIGPRARPPRRSSGVTQLVRHTGICHSPHPILR